MNKNDEATRRAAAYIDEVKEIAARLGYGTSTVSAEVYDRAVQTAAHPVAELMQRGDR